jgi:hypothetical protein
MGCSHPYLFWRLTPSHQQCITIEWVLNHHEYQYISQCIPNSNWTTMTNSNQLRSGYPHSQNECHYTQPERKQSTATMIPTQSTFQCKYIWSKATQSYSIAICAPASSLSMQEHLSRNNYIHNISIGRYSKQTSSIDEYNSKHQSQSKTCCCLIDRQQSKTSCNKRRYWQSNQSRVKCIMKR